MTQARDSDVKLGRIRDLARVLVGESRIALRLLESQL